VTGRYLIEIYHRETEILFQSSPGLVTGRYQQKNQHRSGSAGFNPRPVW